MGNPVPYPALSAELARAGVDQKQIAEALGYHPSQVTKRMRGDVPWRIKELQTVAAHLGISVADIIDDAPAEPVTAGDSTTAPAVSS